MDNFIVDEIKMRGIYEKRTNHRRRDRARRLSK